MLNPKKFLVAYDGSPQSKAALDWALLLGSKHLAELEIIKVFEPVTTQTYTNLEYDLSTKFAARYAEIEKEDRKMLEEVKAICEEKSKMKVHVAVLKEQTAVVKGHVASTLLDYAWRNGIDLIVAGTKGHGVLDEMLVGSVTNSLVSLSKVPVLVVKEKPVKLQKILVAYDGSDSAKSALNLAIDIGKNAGANLFAVKVTDPNDLIRIYGLAESGASARMLEKVAELDNSEKKIMEDAKGTAASKGMELGTEILPPGNIAASIIRYAAQTEADMIVAGTLGHGLLAGMLIGSVTRSLISLTKIPVLVVKK